ncbi:hypothetical protein ACQUWN_10675 [Rossellomorea aquimaris]|nr:hypothetical protein [Rossellomorea vietnamensis]
MDNKPLHYDGTIRSEDEAVNTAQSEQPFTLTPEARKNLGGNPYEVNGQE